jgi:hypothetical protein
LIAQSLATSADDHAARSLSVVNPKLYAVRVAEIEFCQVAVKVCFGNVVINAIDAALQD